MFTPPEATQLPLLEPLELLDPLELELPELLELMLELELPLPKPFEFELLEHAATPRAMRVMAIDRLINARKSELSEIVSGGPGLRP